MHDYMIIFEHTMQKTCKNSSQTYLYVRVNSPLTYDGQREVPSPPSLLGGENIAKVSHPKRDPKLVLSVYVCVPADSGS
jgi:hypothetical protein